MKILFLDIETTPHTVYTFGLFNQNIGVEQIIEPSRVQCFAARWLGASKMQFYSEWGADGKPDEAQHHEMVAAMHALLDEADAVVHWNGASFDIPHLNREFIEAGLWPPSPFKQIDLLLATRKNFQFASNKLAHVSTRLGTRGKMEHEGFPLWRKCLDGDQEAQARMRKYNRRDVDLLVDLYYGLLPWLSAHPNRQLYDGLTADACGTCGSVNMMKRGWAYTDQGRYQRYHCQTCGAYFRSTHRDFGVSTRPAVR
jgi:hypothetical protein